MRFSKEIKIALLAVVALVFLFFGYRFLRGTDVFSSTNIFYAYYDDIQGLEVSNPVVINGLTVGKVQELELLQDKGNSIKVTFDVDKKLKVGDGTIARLGSSDLLGSKAIMLEMGPNSKVYASGATIKSATKGSLTDDLDAEAIPLMRTIDSTVANINSFFTPQSRNSLQNMLTNFEGSSAVLHKMMVENQRNINQITGNISRLTSALLVTEKKLDVLAANLTTITDSVKRADISKAIRNANLAMAEVRSAAAKIDNAQGSLGMLLNDRALYNNMTRATADLDRLLVDFQKNPKRYIHVSVFGKKNKPSDIEVTVDEPGSQMGPNPKFKEAPADTALTRTTPVSVDTAQ